MVRTSAYEFGGDAIQPTTLFHLSVLLIHTVEVELPPHPCFLPLKGEREMSTNDFHLRRLNWRMYASLPLASC